MECKAIGNQKIYFSSSEKMTNLEKNSIDTIITSPPYNRKKTYSDDKGNTFDDNQKEEEYLNFLQSVWSECYRVLKPSGVFFLNIGDSANDQGKSEQVVKSAVNSGFIRIQTIIWLKSFLGKGHYTPSGGDRRLNNLWENLFVLAKNREKYKIYPKDIGVPYSDKSNIGRYSDIDLRDAGNVWFIPYSKTTGKHIKKGHDAPFPIELAIKCIKLSRAKTVLDPFLGTGSTLAAAEVCGIKGFGFEKYPRKNIIYEKINTVERKILDKMKIMQLSELEQTVEYLTTIIERLNKKININNVIKDTKKENIQLEVMKKVVKSIKGSSSIILDLETKIRSQDIKKFI